MDSVAHETLIRALLPKLLNASGLTDVEETNRGGMWLVDARTAQGTWVRFWVKQGWKKHEDYAALQLGWVNVQPRTDQAFLDEVDRLVASAKEKGAQYALFVHMPGETIRDNYAVLEIEDVPKAFRQQMKGWHRLAVNGHTPTLYFDDERNWPEAACAQVVRKMSIPLSGLAGLAPPQKGAPESKVVLAETERRMKQELFRQRVGDRCDWTCVVSGNQVRKVLDAAHLPGKDWRYNNTATDGILLRADLHRLLDAEMAELRDGVFWIREDARCPQYLEYHERKLLVP